VEEEDLELARLVSAEIGLAELQLAPGSELHGRTLLELDFRRRFGPIVLAVRRDLTVLHAGLADTRLEAGDRLLVQGRRAHLDALRESPDFEEREELDEPALAELYRLRGRIFTVRVPEGSILAGKSLEESRLGDALGSGVVGLVRNGERLLMPRADQRLTAGDRLLVRGRRDEVEVFRALQGLEIESEAPSSAPLESEQIGLMEAVLSPRASVAGKTLRDLAFRARYGLRVLAILRQGRVHRSDLRDETLRFGDALLLMGPRERLDLFSSEPDFMILDRPRPVVRTHKAPLSVLIMTVVLVPVLLGWLPIAIAAVSGAALMVLTRCITMDEAYRAIEWRSVFLIAGMLPLGTAMARTGAASFLAEGVLALASPLGAWGIVLALYLVTAAATSVIPTAALVVLMAPIVYDASTGMGVSTHTTMMAVAIAASASFTSPVSHPANVLVMGPGGYRFVDYFKLGIPLTIVVMVVALLVLPIFWPL
jgi:di/tricarboxylate transporter